MQRRRAVGRLLEMQVAASKQDDEQSSVSAVVPTASEGLGTAQNREAVTRGAAAGMASAKWTGTVRQQHRTVWCTAAGPNATGCHVGRCLQLHVVSAGHHPSSYLAGDLIQSRLLIQLLVCPTPSSAVLPPNRNGISLTATPTPTLHTPYTHPRTCSCLLNTDSASAAAAEEASLASGLDIRGKREERPWGAHVRTFQQHAGEGWLGKHMQIHCNTQCPWCNDEQDTRLIGSRAR